MLVCSTSWVCPKCNCRLILPNDCLNSTDSSAALDQHGEEYQHQKKSDSDSAAVATCATGKNSENTTKSSILDSVSTVALIGGATVGVACAIPMVIGFGTAGIVSGSLAALWQSAIGNVAAGSLFATLQSAGATGTFLMGTSAGGVTAVGGLLGNVISSRNKTEEGANPSVVDYVKVPECSFCKIAMTQI